MYLLHRKKIDIYANISLFLSYSEVTVATRSGLYPAQMDIAVTKSSSLISARSAVPKSCGSSSLISARISVPRSLGSSLHVTASSAVFKYCLALRNSFKVSCRSCPRRLVWCRPPASLSRKWKRLLRDPARAPDSSSCSEEASASKPSPGGLPVPVGCPVPSGLSSPVGCPVPPRSVCLQCGPHLPGGGSYVSPLSCVSCGPASCVLIWFVSCPRWVWLLVHSC